MVDFTPRQPNFYGRARNANPAQTTAGTSVAGAGLRAITGGSNPLSSSSYNYNTNTGLSSRNKGIPGVSTINSGVNSSAQAVPPLFSNQVSNSSNFRNANNLTSQPSTGITVSASIGIGVGVNSLNPSLNRLSINGLPLFGSYDTGINPYVNEPGPSLDQFAAFADSNEDRVIISDQTGLFIDSITDFLPLRVTGGVLFPYTPVITMGFKANYEMENLLQNNYSTPYYTGSRVDGIEIQARFTAQNPTEAAYMLAMMTFFRTATKMFYGASQNKGTPPPVLYLDGYGQNVLDHIPVVITNFSYNLPNDVNYITTTEYGGRTNKVPVDLNVTVSCMPTYSRNRTSSFNLTEFASGAALTGKFNPGQRKQGGWA